MRRVALEEFEGLAESYDRSVLATSGIAHYCSSSDWILAAHLHMHQGCPTEIYIEDSHWIVFARGDLYGLGQALHPMESAWCFACPLIGKEPKRMVRMLGRLLSSEDRLRGFVVLGGIPLGSRLHGLLKKEIGRFRRVMTFPGTDCVQANLTGGLEQFLMRRSSRFRAQSKAGQERLSSCGVEFEMNGEGCGGISTFDRVLEVEKRSWKFKSGESVYFHPDHLSFYREMTIRAAKHGRLRVLFARREGRDIAYVMGGLLGKSYRGLQMGFDQSYARFGLGNHAQIQMIRRLANEGVEVYDLGMSINYKLRWGDRILKLMNILVAPS